METQNYYNEIEDDNIVISIEEVFEEDEEEDVWNVYEEYAKFDDPDELENW